MTAQQHHAIEAFHARGYFAYPYGLGDVSQQQASATVASSLQQSAQLATAVGGPLAGAIVEAAAGLAKIVSLFGPNPNNTITTEWVNQVEADVLKPNLAAWQALPADKKYYTLQQTALNTFTQAWGQIVQLCSNPQLGSAGTNCLKDRQRGGKWDWFSYYYDPIANDPQVIPDPVATTSGSVTGAIDSTVTSLSQSLGGISPLWIGVGIIAAALLLVSD
jgi:hypothetical protein